MGKKKSPACGQVKCSSMGDSFNTAATIVRICCNTLPKEEIARIFDYHTLSKEELAFFWKTKEAAELKRDTEREDERWKRKSDIAANYHKRKDDRLKKKAFKSSRQNELQKLTNVFNESQGKSYLLDEKSSHHNESNSRHHEQVPFCLQLF